MHDPFPYPLLRRRPDVEAPNLQAHDATDPLLLAAALAAGTPGAETAIIGDDYGALTLGLLHAGSAGLRVHQDLISGSRALELNRRLLVEDGALRPASDEAFTACEELGEGLLRGTSLVLLKLPRGLAELREIAEEIARWASPDVVVIAGGRVKHMTKAMNEVLGQFFGEVSADLAVRKSRLLTARGLLDPRPESTFPLRVRHEDVFLIDDSEGGRRASLTLCSSGGVFAGERLDHGTRALLSVVHEIPPGRAVDLGCGTGALAAAYAMGHPGAQVLATDRSAAAVRSATASLAANGLAGRVEVRRDDAASTLADGSTDVVLLNPPFHLGASVHAGAALRLFEAAARILRPGGELWTVYNTHLGYERRLDELVGPGRVVCRTAKFTVLRSVRTDRR